jgi:DNA repair protein RAD5
MYTDAKKSFDRLNAKGLVGKNYTHILAMLMRYVHLSIIMYILSLHPHSLRRAVLHPSLVLSSENESGPGSEDGEVDIDSMIRRFSKEDAPEGSGGNAFAEDVLTNLNDSDSNAECPICLDVMQSPMIIPVCMHQW